MEKQHSLQTLLSDHRISADQFFQSQGITSEIRIDNNMARFVNYCHTHRLFATRMLYLALNASTAELQHPETKAAAFAITELLADEETQLMHLFFEMPPKQDQLFTEIPQELENGTHFPTQQEQQKPVAEQTRAIQITRSELTDLTFEILKNPQKNESCLGHLQKIFSFFIRQEPIVVLGYFQQRPEIIKLLINSLNYSAVSSLLAQILTCEDRKKEYKYQTLKKKILVDIIQTIFSQVEDQNYFDGALAFLEEILNTSEQSYYQYFQDFKRISGYLVSAPVLTRFYDELFKLNERSFSCISKFLERLFKRMDGEVQENGYPIKEQQSSSINFQIDLFVKNIPSLINLVPQTLSFNSITRISFLSFLQALISCNPLKSVQLDLQDPSFQNLFDAYKIQQSGGLVKCKIYGLIKTMLNKSSPDQLKSFLEKHPKLYEQYFAAIQSANYSNTKIYNQNENSAFDISLIIQLTKKEQSALSNASKALGKDLKRICKKYDTKMASSQNSRPEQQFNFRQSDCQSTNKNHDENGSTSGFTLNLFGKNSISIPPLHLPEKNGNHIQEHSESRLLQGNQTNQNLSNKWHNKEIPLEQDVIVQIPKLGKLQFNNQKTNQSEKGEYAKVEPTQNLRMAEERVDKEPKSISEKKQNTFFLQLPHLKSAKEGDKKQNKKNEANGHNQQQNAKKANQSSINEEKAKFFTRHLKIYV